MAWDSRHRQLHSILWLKRSGKPCGSYYIGRRMTGGLQKVVTESGGLDGFDANDCCRVICGRLSDAAPRRQYS